MMDRCNDMHKIQSRIQAGTLWRQLQIYYQSTGCCQGTILAPVTAPGPGYDPGAGYGDPGAVYGVATAPRQRWRLAIRYFGLFGGPVAAVND